MDLVRIFAVLETSEKKEILRLKRRFIIDQEATQKYHMQRSMREKKRREARIVAFHL